MRPIAIWQSRYRIFYQMEHACLYSGAVTERIFIADTTLLAQKSSADTKALLIQLDSAGSIIGAMAPHISQLFTPYGASAPGSLVTILAFCGQPLDRASNTYPLGNGRRSFSPSIMRFTTSDSMSPFGRGGPNAYAYCQGDPVNRHDPNGQWWVLHRIVRFSARLLHRGLNTASRLIFNMPAPTLRRTVQTVAAESFQQATRQFETSWNMLPPAAQMTVSAVVALPTVMTVGVTVLAAARTGTPIVPSLQQSAGLFMGEANAQLRQALGVGRH
jgi:RHS repeat-associated protein